MPPGQHMASGDLIVKDSTCIVTVDTVNRPMSLQ